MSQVYQIQTFDEAKKLANKIAAQCPVPSTAAMGICEILLNSIEHGNLGISFSEKQLLQQQGIWLQEVESRIKLKENHNKFVTVEIRQEKNFLIIEVTDCGQGFDWQKQNALEQNRLNGRGIKLARAMTFSELSYKGCGNQVIGKIKL